MNEVRPRRSVSCVFDDVIRDCRISPNRRCSPGQGNLVVAGSCGKPRRRTYRRSVYHGRRRRRKGDRKQDNGPKPSFQCHVFPLVFSLNIMMRVPIVARERCTALNAGDTGTSSKPWRSRKRKEPRSEDRGSSLVDLQQVNYSTLFGQSTSRNSEALPATPSVANLPLLVPSYRSSAEMTRLVDDTSELR